MGGVWVRTGCVGAWAGGSGGAEGAAVNAVVYARVSSSMQGRDNRVSIPEQLAACHRLAEAGGLSVAAELVDKEKYRGASGRLVEPSGTRADRPGFVQLLDMLARGEAGAVVAWSQDRLARGGPVTVLFRDAVEQAGAEVRLVVGTWDADTAEIIGAIGGYELRRIRQRMAMGKDGRHKRGLHPSNPPFGYRPVRDDRGRSVGYELIESEAEQLRALASMYVRRIPLEEIAMRLPPHARTGRPWWPSSLNSILHNPFYFGVAAFKGDWAAASHPLVWDAETVAVIERERDRRAAVGKGGVRRRKFDYLFSGVIKCAYCGRALIASTSNASFNRGYRCPAPYRARMGYAGYELHDWNSISEARAWAWLRGEMSRLSDEEIAAAVAESGPDAMGKRRAAAVAAATQLDGRISELRAALAAVRGVPTAAALIESELIRVQSVRERLAVDVDRPVVEVDNSAKLRRALALRDTIVEGIDMPRAVLRELIAETIPELWVWGGCVGWDRQRPGG